MVDQNRPKLLLSEISRTLRDLMKNDELVEKCLFCFVFFLWCDQCDIRGKQYLSMTMCEDTKLKSFDFQDCRFYELVNGIDPDTHFYQNVNMTCEYYLEEELNA